jgi:L-lactate dehydrogenase complex protein LldG
MSSRDVILGRVRDALAAGRRAGAAPPLPVRGQVGYQGAGPDPLARFVEMNRAMGARPQTVASRDEGLERLLPILESKKAKKILLGSGPVIDTWQLGPWLAERGYEVVRVGDGPVPRETLFAADIGITGVSALVAETGSLVVAAGPTEPRSTSLLPPVHIAIASKEQIVPDLFDLLEGYGDGTRPPSNLVLITGPSKTGDIELKLVTGVHGPGEVHVIVQV